LLADLQIFVLDDLTSIHLNEIDAFVHFSFLNLPLLDKKRGAFETKKHTKNNASSSA
jgi:hypothetical protein